MNIHVLVDCDKIRKFIDEESEHFAGYKFNREVSRPRARFSKTLHPRRDYERIGSYCEIYLESNSIPRKSQLAREGSFYIRKLTEEQKEEKTGKSRAFRGVTSQRAEQCAGPITKDVH